jgi:ribosome-binding ATPase
MLIGIIGKSNVGKSTFFNAVTDLSVQTANYPFTTIEPNVGVAYVRIDCICREFEVQDNPVHSVCIDGIRFIPVKVIDIAGLVPGAHLGKGIGNKFLDDSRQADALIHVVDASGSTDSEGRPVAAGTADPLYDIKFVEEEFDRWLCSIIGKEWSKFAREVENKGQRIDLLLTKRLSGLAIDDNQITRAINRANLNNKKPTLWQEEDIFNLSRTVRILSKPTIIAANKIDIPSTETNIMIMKENGYANIIPCASEAEVLLRRAAKKGILHYLPGDRSFEIRPNVSLSEQQTKVLNTISTLFKKYCGTGVQDVLNKLCFDSLKFIAVFPVEDEFKLTDKKGNVLPDTYLLPAGSTPKDLAFKIHADIAKSFLYAIDVRTKQRLGAEYVLKHRDVIKLVSTTSRR